MTTNARPVFVGNALRSAMIASRPPAEAPMAATGIWDRSRREAGSARDGTAAFSAAGACFRAEGPGGFDGALVGRRLRVDLRGDRFFVAEDLGACLRFGSDNACAY